MFNSPNNILNADFPHFYAAGNCKQVCPPQQSSIKTLFSRVTHYCASQVNYAPHFLGIGLRCIAVSLG